MPMGKLMWRNVSKRIGPLSVLDRKHALTAHSCVKLMKNKIFYTKPCILILLKHWKIRPHGVHLVPETATAVFPSSMHGSCKPLSFEVCV